MGSDDTFAFLAEPLRVVVPIRTVSASNAREHWSQRAKRVKRERHAVLWLLTGKKPRLPATVTLTRVTGSLGRELDDDNLRGCLKAVRDGVADWLGVPDNDPRVTWRYAQRKGSDWAVELEVAT